MLYVSQPLIHAYDQFNGIVCKCMCAMDRFSRTDLACKVHVCVVCVPSLDRFNVCHGLHRHVSCPVLNDDSIGSMILSFFHIRLGKRIEHFDIKIALLLVTTPKVLCNNVYTSIIIHIICCLVLEKLTR